jgi:adenosylcobinamide kinase/adenosylcobinamide-phosphate guanylyltransferase
MWPHHHHLIVGGQRSGKSRQAEHLATQWLAASPQHSVAVVATAQAWDEEMRLRIARHQADRPTGMATVEEPLHLGRVLNEQAVPGRLLLVDCLTLWLTNWLMPASGQADQAAWRAERDAMLAGLASLPSPVVFVSNEVGWGIIPMSREVRVFVDELGWLNQAVAERCGLLTLMVAGQAWTRPVERPCAG